MTYGKTLEDYLDDGSDDIYEKQVTMPNMGKIVRDSVYHSMDQDNLGNQQRILLECYLQHPKGLTDIEAEKILGIRNTSVSGRRNELIKMGFPVGTVDIVYNPDYKGRVGQPNNRWGIISNGGTI